MPTHREGMEEVPADVFFAAIGGYGAHPRAVDVKGRYHASSWELSPSRREVGYSVSDSHGSGRRMYFLISTRRG
jgi:hypothetical protein